MNYETFLTIAEGVTKIHNDEFYVDRPWHASNKVPAKKYLKVSWMVGGTQGGNCWSEGGHYSLTAEPEPEFNAIDLILAKVCPNISFIQYKARINDKLIHTFDSTDNEYYGNYTKYRAKVVYMEELYDAIKDLL